MKKLFFLSVLIFILHSCYYDKEEEIYGPVTCDVTDVTYSSHVAPIINSSCATTGCHVSGGSGPGNFTVFNELIAKVNNGSFENRVLIQQTMPPNSELSECDLQTLEIWINNGAPNN